MIQVQIDQRKSEQFAQQMLSVLNHGAISLMVSIGHRTGLFDAMASMPPSPSRQIADRIGLNERYVREWLGAMVTGRIVEYDADRRTYRLPPEHAAFLTRAARPNNMAAICQYFSVLAGVEDRIVECFRNGGGVPYEAFKRFHEVMAEESDQTVVAALDQTILPMVPGLRERLETGIDVLDIGCGSGGALNRMAQLFPKSRFTGYDFCKDAIARAETQAARLGLDNVRFRVKDVARLDDEGPYDLVTAFDAIHDQAAPDKVLSEIARVLRDDGTFLMQDIAASSQLHENMDHPIGPFIYTISTMHCMTVSLAHGGMGLGTAWGRQKAEEMLANAGFTSVRVESLPHDFQNYWFIARKAPQAAQAACDPAYSASGNARIETAPPGASPPSGTDRHRRPARVESGV